MNNIPTAKHCIVKKKYLKVLQKLEVKKKESESGQIACPLGSHSKGIRL